MRITLGQLMEVMSAVAGGGSGWVPTAKDIRFVEYRDDYDEPLVDEYGKLVGPDDYKHDDTDVVFYVDGPWEQGPLKVIIRVSYLFNALGGRRGDQPMNTDIDLYWSNPKMRADWEETDMDFSDLAAAANDAGILL